MPKTPRPKRIALALTAFLLSAVVVEARVRTFLLSGQSNMVGFGLVSAVSIPEESPSVVIWNAVGGRGKAWTPLGGGFGVDDTTFGPEVSLGTTLSEAFPADTIRLIKGAVAGSSLAVDWLPPSVGGPGVRYSNLQDWFDLANQDWPTGPPPPIDGVFWMQGESDGADSVWAFSYQRHLEALISDIRSRHGDSLLPWVVGLIDSQASWPHCGTVRFAQRRVAESLPMVGLVETKGLATDKVHYLAEGYLELGRRMAWRWLVLNGFREDTTTPRDTTGAGGPGTDTSLTDTTGAGGPGTDTSLTDTTGAGGPGTDTSLTDTTGAGGPGTDTSLTDTTGAGGPGTDTSLTDTTGAPRIPVSLSERARMFAAFPQDTRLQWVRLDGVCLAEWVQGRSSQPDPKVFRGHMGLLVAWFPDGHREIRRSPPFWRR